MDSADRTGTTLTTNEWRSPSLPQRVDDALLQHSLHLLMVQRQARAQRLVEDEVEDGGEVKHGEEGGVQVAGVVVTLDSPLLAAHYRQLLRAVHLRWAYVATDVWGFQRSKLCTTFCCRLILREPCFSSSFF